MGRGRKRYQVEGLLGTITQSWEPTRVFGVAQKGSPDDPPLHCPKCGMGEPHWQRGYWTAMCLCGERWVRTRGHMTVRHRYPVEPGGRPRDDD